MPSSKGGGGIQTLVTNRQTEQKQHAFLKGWGGIQTLVTNRQTGQKQHAFLKGGEAYKL